jgi:RNA 2',3'-cyclic 3'-phosphodiesterase
MARLFTAIELSPEVRAAVVACQADLAAALQRGRRDDLRLVPPAQMHLTLVFIGEVTEDRVTAIEGAFESGFTVQPFEIELGTCGVFPPRGPARVLWLGVTRGARELATIVDLIGARLEPLGVHREERPFTAHLTVGRWRHGDPDARQRLPRVGQIAVQPVADVTLFRSRLLPGGPEHSVLVRAPLAGGGAAVH